MQIRKEANCLKTAFPPQIGKNSHAIEQGGGGPTGQTGQKDPSGAQVLWGEAGAKGLGVALLGQCKGPEVEMWSRNTEANVIGARSTNSCLKYQYDVDKPARSFEETSVIK